jgi:hypothetical protein
MKTARACWPACRAARKTPTIWSISVSIAVL